MSQWAREHPELYEQGVTYLDAHSDHADWWDKTDDAVRRPQRPAESETLGEVAEDE